MIYLINQTTFQQYEDITVNIKPERLKVFIKKAQELDLKPFLGHALYYDFLNHFNEDGTLQDDAPQPYKDLLNGTEYLDDYGHIVLYEGLAPTMVYFTFARFIENDAVHYTATGPVIKRHENGDALSSPEVVKLVQQQRSIANAYANDIEKFLWDNKADFPLWRYNAKNKSSRQAGPRIRGVDKTDFNYPGSYNNYNLTITEFLN
ncbi:DUF6712 family protein [Mucilaginibacter ginsenosidivorax]|uniref:Uncharacterized protein n=1 Tax=Mucilaginibacter ginsenosidivorax TaxID=862126 RepID=A0A5B8W4R6_9SPHI|nr:hypothetical protein [Mucilaginibacter ginsenosidivorax]QEC79050.1 hypothetical protein FSB76_25005 [Mucilaginibacter ginsenosidivorax]